jgi:hypothetical protein
MACVCESKDEVYGAASSPLFIGKTRGRMGISKMPCHPKRSWEDICGKPKISQKALSLFMTTFFSV